MIADLYETGFNITVLCAFYFSSVSFLQISRLLRSLYAGYLCCVVEALLLCVQIIRQTGALRLTYHTLKCLKYKSLKSGDFIFHDLLT